MYDFRSVHVGKDLYRAKSQEEDINIINEITKAEFPVSLKAYGDGPLQLSTDKSSSMFPRLQLEGTEITDAKKLTAIFDEPVFSAFTNINVLPLIYDEKKQRCNILVFDSLRARAATARIAFDPPCNATNATNAMSPRHSEKLAMLACLNPSIRACELASTVVLYDAGASARDRRGPG